MLIVKSYRFIVAIVVLVLVGSLLAQDRSDVSHLTKTKLLRGGQEARSISVDILGVKDLYLVVTFGPDNYRSDQAIWADPVLIDKAGAEVDLAGLKPMKVQVGWGQLYVNRNHSGQPLRIGSRTFAKGFWAHGPSMLHFRLDGRYARFRAQVGIDKGAGSIGSSEFIVMAVAPKMPSKADYMDRPAPSLPIPPSAAESLHTLNPDAVRALLEKGIDRLVFIRRYTLNANHVYTEYVNSRWSPGGGLCILDLKTGRVRELARELGDGVFNRFDISYDGAKIIFDFKKGPLDGYRIYEIDVDGNGLRQLTFPPEGESELVRLYGSGSYHHGTDDLHPCYLPDGGIVFATTRCQYGVLCDVSDTYTTKNLYRMDANGQSMRPLSNSPLSEASPAMMPDGRILYHRWEYVDKAAGNLKCLWAMNPDGTATAEVYGNTIAFPETMIYARPIPGAAGKIVMLGASHCCPNNAMGAVIVIDTSNDVRATETMRFVTDDIRAFAHTGFHFQDPEGQWKLDQTGALGRLFKDPYPLSENLFIATCKPKGFTWDAPRAYDLVLLDGQGSATPLYKDEAISCWHPYPLRARVKPPVIANVTHPDLARQELSLCFVADVYQGMEGVTRGTVKYLRILEEVPRPWAARKSWFRDDRDGMAHTAMGDDLLGLKVQYGVVPVEADGSAHFHVPALRNIYFQALDANCRMVQTERTYVHYMPGEVRSCIGCHEKPNNTPRATVAAVSLAMRRSPSMPAPQPGETRAKRLFDYDRQIQPIWDRHCIQCHSSETIEGDLNLAGDPEGVYSVSYNNLVKLSRSKKQLLGYRTPRNEDAGSAGIEYIPPYALGALTSPLAAMLSLDKIRLRDLGMQAYVDSLAESHCDVRLSEMELLEVTTWLDINCQFHPSYWGRLNAKFKDHPNYRPEVTFDEALLRTIPDSVVRQEGITDEKLAVAPR